MYFSEVSQDVSALGGVGVKQKCGGKTGYFRAKCVNISETSGNTSKVIYILMTDRKLHMHFRLASR